MAEPSDSLVDLLAVEERGEPELRLPGWFLPQPGQQNIYSLLLWPTILFFANSNVPPPVKKKITFLGIFECRYQGKDGATFIKG